jgi:hypothetical protein
VVLFCLCAPAVPAQSLFFPARNDVEAGVTAAGVPINLDSAGIHVATGDIDDDGILDAVVTVRLGEPEFGDPNSTDDEVIFIYEGDGRGLFLEPIVLTLPRGTYPGAVVTGKFNSDSHLDFAVAVEDLDGTGGATAGGVMVFFGDGAFGGTGPDSGLGQEALSGLTALAAGNLDGDTVEDLVLLNSASDSYTVFMSPGFAPSTSVTTCGGPVAVDLGELDLSPSLDMAVACDPTAASDQVQTWKGAGNGTFTVYTGQPAPTSLNDPRGLVIADLNDDGDNDIAIANRHGLDAQSIAGDVTLLNNDGTGNFVEFSASPVVVGDTPLSIDAGDIDDDGDTDLLLANLNTEDVSVLEATVTGTGQNRQPSYDETFFTSGFQAMQALFADLNGLGNLDLVVVNANEFNGTLSSFLGGGDDLVQRADVFNSPNVELPNAMAVADFDGSGDPGDMPDDFAVVNELSDTVAIFRSTAGNLVATEPFELLDELTFAVGDFPFDILSGDLDDDGDADLLVLLSPDPIDGSGSVAVYANNGNGIFSSVTTLSVGNFPFSMALANFDGDTDEDLVVTNQLDQTFSVFQGTSGAGFTSMGTESTLNPARAGSSDCTPTPPADPTGPDCEPSGIAAGDFNDDGDMDVVVATFGDGAGGALQLFQGDGAMGFTHVGELLTPDPLYPSDSISNEIVLVGNLDGDTNNPPDIVAVGLAPDDFITVHLNDGAANFTFSDAVNSPFLMPSMDFAPDYAPRNSLLEDLNADDLPDLAVLGFNSNNVAVLLGEGDGTFEFDTARAQAFGTTNAPRALATGDFNGDNILDMLAASQFDSFAILESGFVKRSDINGTGRVDGFDLAQLGRLFGVSEGDPDYEFYLDINMDGTIDGSDLTYLAEAFGRSF